MTSTGEILTLCCVIQKIKVIRSNSITITKVKTYPTLIDHKCFWMTGDEFPLNLVGVFVDVNYEIHEVYSTYQAWIRSINLHVTKKRKYN